MCRTGHAFFVPPLMVLGLRGPCCGVLSISEALESLDGCLSVQLQPPLGHTAFSLDA